MSPVVLIPTTRLDVFGGTLGVVEDLA